MDELPKPSSAHRSGMWALWVMLALTIYVLSIGPASAIVTRYQMSDRAFHTLLVFYWPLRCLEDYPTVARRVEAYESWCDRAWSPSAHAWTTHPFLFRQSSFPMTGTGVLILNELPK